MSGKKAEKFPPCLYVKRVEDRDSSWYEASEDIDSHAELSSEMRVAVYTLSEVVVVTTEIKTKPVGKG